MALSGQILDVEEAPLSVMGRGSLALAESREVLFRSWVRQSSRLRRPLRQSVAELMSTLDVAGFTKDQLRLLAAGRRRMERAARRTLSAAISDMESTIEEGVGQAIRRAQRSQLQHLEGLGLKLSRAQISAIQDVAMLQLDAEFPPGSGQTFRTRMRALESRQQDALTRSLSRQGDGAAKLIARDLRDGLTHQGPGRSPTRGGSAFKQGRRILVAEQTRLSNRVEVDTMRAAGVDFAYWRLNPAHRWYGGREICEHLASRTDPSIGAELERLGVPVDSVLLQGLHRLSDWPQYPHPFCKCYPEAFLPPELLPDT